jgi:hypothetical protein
MVIRNSDPPLLVPQWRPPVAAVAVSTRSDPVSTRMDLREEEATMEVKLGSGGVK